MSRDDSIWRLNSFSAGVRQPAPPHIGHGEFVTFLKTASVEDPRHRPEAPRTKSIRAMGIRNKEEEDRRGTNTGPRQTDEIGGDIATPPRAVGGGRRAVRGHVTGCRVANC
ncbi:hypothetical protein EVAR_87658_1 [Eumeta japonica]|uniref:Uncharacterized protein n=1 Tax=Eumeta variegata TaxID=151549 RepID=A0A4C1WIN8_EUMVA|nr:hypothetical protein EVAR_87658_1 [Eumeta japonica]